MTKDAATPFNRAKRVTVGCLSLCVKGLTLVVGWGVAWCIGMAIAEFFPAPLQQIQLHQQIRTTLQFPVRRLQSITHSSSRPVVVPSARSNQATTLRDTEVLIITLPGEILFQANPQTLHPNARDILDSVVRDLRNYPRAAVQVAAHMDNRGNSAASRDVSMGQAIAVQQYLAAALGSRLHWVTVGYGHSQPLVHGSGAVDRQRNHRIEILIRP